MRALLLVPLVGLLLSACGPGGYVGHVLRDYLYRVNNVTDHPTVDPDEIRPTLSLYPRPRDLRRELSEPRMGAWTSLGLSRCDLQTLVAGRNASLGRVQAPSQRLLYEVAFLGRARVCLEEMSQEEAATKFATQLVAAVDIKQQELPLALWNATLGGRELASLFSLSGGPLPFDDADWDLPAITDTLRSLHQEADRLVDTASQRRSGTSEPPSLERHLGRLARSRAGGRLLVSLDLLATTLEGAAQALEARQSTDPLCPQGRPTEEAAVLQTVFQKFYVGALQPYLAQVHRRGGALLEAVADLVEPQLDVAPAPFLTYWSGQLSPHRPEGLWARFESALHHHTSAWQEVLDSCGMAPGSPTDTTGTE